VYILVCIHFVFDGEELLLLHCFMVIYMTLLLYIIKAQVLFS